MFLAGDLGGTKVSFAVYSEEQGPREPLARVRLPSADYPSLEAAVRDFLGKHHLNVTRATFGVAGPVVKGRAQITNLPWIVDTRRLMEELELEKVALINDLAAVAYAIPHLTEDEVVVVQEGEVEEHGTIGVIAPGTGLGQAFITNTKGVYTPFASEGGHTDFAPADALQFGLLRYLKERFGHVSYERICSGSGLPNIYNYLRDVGYSHEPAWLTEELAAADDRTPIIVRAAQDESNPVELCVGTLKVFVSVLGAETGNLALKILATGGIYLGGGMPLRLINELTDGYFLQSYLNKGRFSDLLTKFPVKIITHPEAGLFGSALHAFEQANLT